MGCYFFHINFNRKYAIPWTRPEPVLRSLARPLHRTWRVFLTWTSVRRVWFCHWKGCGLRLQGCRELIERNSWLKIKGNFFFSLFKWLSRSISYGCPSLMAVRLLSSKRTWFRWPKCLSGVQVHPEDRQPEDFVPGWKFSFVFQEFFEDFKSYLFTQGISIDNLSCCAKTLPLRFPSGNQIWQWNIFH